MLITDCAKLGAGIHSEANIGMLRTRDLDHSLGEVNASNKSAPVTEFLRQIPCTATCVEHREPAYIACEFPQYGVGIQDSVPVSVITNLDPPVVGDAVPEIPDFFKFTVAHRPFSCIMLPLSHGRRGAATRISAVRDHISNR